MLLNLILKQFMKGRKDLSCIKYSRNSMPGLKCRDLLESHEWIQISLIFILFYFVVISPIRNIPSTCSHVPL